MNYLNYYGYDMINTGIGHWGPGGGYMGSTIGGSPVVIYDSKYSIPFLFMLLFFIHPIEQTISTPSNSHPLLSYLSYTANLTTVVISPLQNVMVGIHSLSPHFGGQEV